jgi:PIN domain nuclease of toxin-antitoxin system
MRVLVDTHTILWAGLAPACIGKRATAILANKSNEVLVSAATVWEIATKEGVAGAVDRVEEVAFECLRSRQLVEANLPITAAHALAEDIPILSTDKSLDAFGITRIC